MWFIAVNVHLLHAFHTFQRNDRRPWKCIVVRFDLDLGKRQNLIHHQKPDYDNWEFLLTYKSKISFKFTEHAENVCILISIFHFSQHLQSSPNVIHVKYRGVLMSSPFHWKCYLISQACFVSSQKPILKVDQGKPWVPDKVSINSNTIQTTENMVKP